MTTKFYVIVIATDTHEVRRVIQPDSLMQLALTKWAQEGETLLIEYGMSLCGRYPDLPVIREIVKRRVG